MAATAAAFATDTATTSTDTDSTATKQEPTTRVVNVRRHLKQAHDVYIGRESKYTGHTASKWANPFSVKRYGLQRCLKKYRSYVLKRPDLMAALPELRGKRLGCWCAPNPCHGDILIELLEQYHPLNTTGITAEVRN